MVGAPLDVQEPPGVPVGGEDVHQAEQRDLRGVGSAGEHRLPREQPAHGHAVQAAEQLAVAPGLHRVRPAEPVEPAVGGGDRGGDPAAGAGRVGAAGDHGVEGGVDAHLEPGARAPQRPGDHEPVERQDAARVGAPPADRLGAAVAQPHREQAQAVGGQQGAGREVGPGAGDLVALGPAAPQTRQSRRQPPCVGGRRRLRRGVRAQWKESPQAQELCALGLSMVKPCFSMLSAKSISAPSR